MNQSVGKVSGLVCRPESTFKGDGAPHAEDRERKSCLDVVSVNGCGASNIDAT